MPICTNINHNVIWIAILIGCLSGCFFGLTWLSLILTLVWFIRICCLKQRRLMAWAAVSIIFFGVWFWHTQQAAISNTMPDQTGKTLILKVQPDELRIEAGRLQLSGKTADGQTIQGQYFADDQAELDRYRLTKTAIVQVHGDISQPPPATNANEFDFRQYQIHQGIYNTIKIDRLTPLTISNASGPVSWWVNSCHALRAELIRRTFQLPKTLQLYVQGLFLGWRATDFYESLNAVTDLGLIHLFSISGFHIVWIVSLVEFFLKRFGVSRLPIAVCLLILLPTYYILAGSQMGLFRAVIVVALGLLAEIFNWRLTGLTLWGLSLLFGLFVQPALLMHLGGQLSYGLALGLLFTHQMGPLKTTIMLNLVSLPLILYHIYQWHVLTMFVNLLILPVFSVCIFPLVLVAGVFGHLMPWLVNFTEWLLLSFTAGLNWVDGLPGMIVFGKPAVLVVASMMIFTLVILSRHYVRRASALLAILYLGSFLWIHFPRTGEVTFFDIGQGDSFLVRAPFNRQVTMIDTGGRVNFGGQKISGRSRAQRISLNYLKSRGISRIDNLCLSHQDADHVGDVGDVLQGVNVKRLYVPIGMTNNQQFMKRVRPYLVQTMILPVQAGQTISGTTLRVVHPFKPGMGTNEDSMVLAGDMGGLRWLFTGDLDRAGEKEILAHYPELRTDVLKLGHHGSKTSSDPEVVKMLQPKIGVISAGRNNRYGHPNQETLATLAADHIPVFNTQHDGMIRYQFVNQIGSGRWQTFLKEDQT
ncbi:DNA internalization-related competence protein ComEC/Rec2 [Secundilactobacillus folii]|uniref:DNA internalization-related competence protein ComEC/Rec2 n=1 Tax=Secundilactobacillus folii TaxID=2678357 RepID=A0A7X2XTF7_9LACO|nr:DNA internalization-related competence protein ComEC/Rec2 [Secundilactobacillus folii]MTV81352.1 DNA internalization-related competence protein ComEC/Rec2 [Secundilactobacillus folii]